MKRKEKKKRVEKASRESDVWEIINKERKERKEVNKCIQLKEWKEHFKRLLEEVECRVI